MLIIIRAARVCCIIRWELLDKMRSELEFVDACNYEKSKVEDNYSPFNPTFDVSRKAESLRHKYCTGATY